MVDQAPDCQSWGYMFYSPAPVVVWMRLKPRFFLYLTYVKAKFTHSSITFMYIYIFFFIV